MTRAFSVNQHFAQAAAIIRAELRGGDQATALGLVVRSPSPIIGLCRELIARGFDPDLPLHPYRGDTLALIVRSIGQAANLEIDGHGTGFRPAHKGGPASPMRQTRRGGA